MTVLPPPPTLDQLASTTAERAAWRARLASRTTVPAWTRILDRDRERAVVGAAYRAGGEAAAIRAIDLVLWQITRGRARTPDEARALVAWIRTAREQAVADVREAVEEGLLSHHTVSEESTTVIAAAWHAARDAYIAGREVNEDDLDAA